ncbi:MAG TPA: hypothetical protein PKN71_05365 [Bacillota bacterium]|jgi:hypothetical protein|nr:hypothetical protein [Bacillota bacterium]
MRDFTAGSLAVTGCNGFSLKIKGMGQIFPAGEHLGSGKCLSPTGLRSHKLL